MQILQLSVAEETPIGGQSTGLASTLVWPELESVKGAEPDPGCFAYDRIIISA